MVDRYPSNSSNYTGDEVAVIGMSCRLPGAADIRAFWRNLRDGVASIQRLSLDVLRERGVVASLLEDPAYVKVAAFLDDPEGFDANFFGMSHREAEITDPQHRVLLECAWTALEHAAYDPETFAGAIGIFAGATLNSYLLCNLAAAPEAIADLEPVQLNIGNASDFLATRIAYKFNLKGPCYAIQSACSTSLVAVAAACDSLVDEGCDMALAGGVSVNVSLRNGYRWLEGGMTSPDGCCRPFDARAQGTVFGSGAGLVVLKRLADALDDGDTIHAVIRGWAVNNDGSLKVGYTAPGLEGQHQVIAEALANADISARTVTYVEAHGTATPLGDPIEVQALTRAFREHTQASGYCVLGSVKGNIGHLDAAAGIAGLIKTVLALKHRQIPATLHFKEANPHIDFAASPFQVSGGLRDWPADQGPRRAGVSAFGVGGTNAHLVLEETPETSCPRPESGKQLVVLSAKSKTSLENMTTRLIAELENRADLTLAHIAFSLQVGRKAFERRRFVLAGDCWDAAAALRDSSRIFQSAQDGQRRPLVFLFPGQGAQFPGMGRALYEREAVFRERVDQCAEYLKKDLGLDLREWLYPPASHAESVDLTPTHIAQPALFVTEYALAQQLRHWGFEPEAMLGHSLGEYVAASLADVFTLEEGLSLVAYRARLMGDLPGGRMIAVPLSEYEVETFLEPGVSLAAVNAPARCVISGTAESLRKLEQHLTREGVAFRPLHTSHAFHSPMMEPILDALTKYVSTLRPKPPRIPILSNLTGTWMTAEQATDPGYWARHARGTVRFADGLSALLAGDHRVFLEVGPGPVLADLLRQHPHFDGKRTVLGTLSRVPKPPEDERLLKAVGGLWLAGHKPRWERLHPKSHRRRIPLPTYAFEHRRYWIEPDQQAVPSQGEEPIREPVREPVPHAATDLERLPMEHWCSLAVWQRSLPPRLDRQRLSAKARTWLLFVPEPERFSSLVTELTAANQRVVPVQPGRAFERQGSGFIIEPANREGYAKLLHELAGEGRHPDVILHAWLMDEQPKTGAGALDRAMEWGYFSLIYLARALSDRAEERRCRLLVAATRLFALTAGEQAEPEKALVLGPSRIIPQETDRIVCQAVDASHRASPKHLMAMALDIPEEPHALRGGQCWERHFQPVFLPRSDFKIDRGSVVLFTGGLIEMGIETARHLARRGVRLTFLEEAGFPEPEQWQAWQDSHGKHDPISAMIENAEDLRRSGTEITVASADFANENAVHDAVARLVARSGPIHGLVHNARVLGERAFRGIRETGPEESQWQFVPKVHGLIHLAQALEDQPLQFAVAQSSLASLLGGTGMVAYAAANAFVDHFVQALNQKHHGVWTTINWDAWQQTQVSALSTAWARQALCVEEALEVFDRILAQGGVDQVVVSTVDLACRRPLLAQARQKARARLGGKKRHPRPELATPYQEPDSPLENQIAEVWQRVLGLEKVGVADNFFELGGDSLLAIKVADHLKRELGMEIPTISLYEGLTVKAVAQSLEEGGQVSAEALQVEQRQARKQRMRQMQQRLRAQRQPGRIAPSLQS